MKPLSLKKKLPPTPTATPTQTATDCSAIPQECRITIPELTDATRSEDTDLFIVSKGGESFKVSMNEMIENIITDQRFINNSNIRYEDNGGSSLDGNMLDNGQWTGNKR